MSLGTVRPIEQSAHIHPDHICPVQSIEAPKDNHLRLLSAGIDQDSVGLRRNGSQKRRISLSFFAIELPVFATDQYNVTIGIQQGARLDGIITDGGKGLGHKFDSSRSCNPNEPVSAMIGMMRGRTLPHAVFIGSITMGTGELLPWCTKVSFSDRSPHHSHPYQGKPCGCHFGRHKSPDNRCALLSKASFSSAADNSVARYFEIEARHFSETCNAESRLISDACASTSKPGASLNTASWC